MHNSWSKYLQWTALSNTTSSSGRLGPTSRPIVLNQPVGKTELAVWPARTNRPAAGENGIV